MGHEGLSQISSQNKKVEPPDSWMAVGPEHFIQTTNDQLQIRFRTLGGGTNLGFQELFGLPSAYEMTDPRAMYDSRHGRWIITEVSWICQAGDGHAYGYLDLLVSDTVDPLGSYTGWFWEYQDYFPDDGALGTSTDKLAWGVNLYPIPQGFASGCMEQPTTFEGVDILVFDWNDLLAGGGANDEIDTVEVSGNSSFSSPRVALQAPASMPDLNVVMQFTPDGLVYEPYYVQIDGSAVADTARISAEFNLVTEGLVSAWVEPPPPMQGGPDVVTTEIDSRPTDAIQQGRRFLFVSNYGCVPTGGAELRDCVRVTELDIRGVTDTTPPSRTQDFLVAHPELDSYFGGIGLAGNGDLHVVWTHSGSTLITSPTANSAVQLSRDPANSLGFASQVAFGTGTYPGSRWGEYVGVAQDSQVPNAVWHASPYSIGALGWQTWIAQLQTEGSTYTPIDPVRVLDSRPAYEIGLSGVFKANVPRTWKVGGFEVDGNPVVPDDAIAVTGNFVVVNQTAAGYAAVTPTPTANPTTSSLNFPLGDTRANNVTIPLSANGALSAVFKAPAGKTTHFIFDVTGYFLAGTSAATYEPITPTRVLDSRAAYSIGLSGPFVANVPRTLSIAGANGIPADAVAVTANLAITGQTKAGYASVTPDPDPNPATATINVPLGDTRANGLTARLNGSGDLSVVWKASGGTTHVILDVTGYYQNWPNGLKFFPLNPGRIMDTRPGVLLSRLTGPFTAKVPRSIGTQGHFGIGMNEGAITGNLSIVGQTAGGYAVITPNADPNPPTATINFPYGDIRGNGVTVPVNQLSNISFVYRATTGAKTHMILDVTGYFQ